MIIRKYWINKGSMYVIIPAEYVHKWELDKKDYVAVYDTPTGAIVLQFIKREDLENIFRKGGIQISYEVTRD